MQQIVTEPAMQQIVTEPAMQQIAPPPGAVKIQLMGKSAAYVYSEAAQIVCSCGQQGFCPHIEAALACHLISAPSGYHKRRLSSEGQELMQVLGPDDLLYHNADCDVVQALLSCPVIEIYIPPSPPGSAAQSDYLLIQAAPRQTLPLVAYQLARRLGGDEYAVALKEMGDGAALGVWLAPCPAAAASGTRPMPNTQITYRYTDAGNYKQEASVVVTGHLELADISPHLEDSEFFIPAQVGLSDLQTDFTTGLDPELDHVWHSFAEFTPTDQPPTTDISAAQLIARCGTVRWDVVKAMRAVGLL